MNEEKLAIRVDETNPDHHLWNNNGTWWVHYTVHPDALTSVRRRKSLRTKCLDHAREVRDQLLVSLAGASRSIQTHRFGLAEHDGAICEPRCTGNVETCWHGSS